MKRVLILLLALLAAIPGAACAEGTTAVAPIRIGVFEPLSGSMAEGGRMELEGIRVANAQYPEVLGRPVELVIADNKSGEHSALVAAQSLVDAGVDIVLGSWGSSLAIVGGPVFEEASLPAVGTSCTSPQVTEGNTYYVRVCYLDDFQGTIMARYARDTLNASTAAILYDVTSVYAIGLRNYFLEAFGQEGLVAEAYFAQGDTDFTSQLMGVMALAPDVVFLPSGYTEPGLIMQQTRALGFDDATFLGVDAWEMDAFLSLGGHAVEGCYFATFFDPSAAPTAEARRFLAGYRALYGGTPKSAVTALGYDAYLAAIQAIEAAGTTDGPAILDALYGLSFEGATGAISFDDNGDAIKNQAVIKTVRDGAFAYVDTITLTMP